ncbi:MAG: YheU family protein [Myxococcales bacterium]
MSDDAERPVRVPLERIPPQTLRAIAEDFCTRDGTDYGEQELSLEQKVTMLMGQLRRGEAHILFEATSSTLRIVATDALPPEG